MVGQHRILWIGDAQTPTWTPAFAGVTEMRVPTWYSWVIGISLAVRANLMQRDKPFDCIILQLVYMPLAGRKPPVCLASALEQRDST